MTLCEMTGSRKKWQFVPTNIYLLFIHSCVRVSRCGVSETSAIRLVVQQLVQAENKETIKALDYWPIVRGIQRLPMDSPHKGPVLPKACPYLDVIMAVITWSYVLAHVR